VAPVIGAGKAPMTFNNFHSNLERDLPKIFAEMVAVARCEGNDATTPVLAVETRDTPGTIDLVPWEEGSIVPALFDSPEGKSFLAGELLPCFFEMAGVVRFALVAEGWTSSDPAYDRPSNDPNRGESVALYSADREQALVSQFKIKRVGTRNKPRVGKLLSRSAPAWSRWDVSRLGLVTSADAEKARS
jgi:hypothetical protein